MRRFATLIFLLLPFLVSAQTIQVNKTNKTITVTADEKVAAPAEVVSLKVGYRAFGPTSGAVFQEISQAGKRIVDALIKAGLPADTIETGDASLSRVPPDENWTPEMKKQRLFGALQS